VPVLTPAVSRPEKDTPANTKYNYSVSRVRVKSEHCVRFIKGHWSSLQGLWSSSIALNTSSLHVSGLFPAFYSMDHEEGTDLSSDEFYQEGLRLVDAEHLHQTACQASVEAHVQATDSEREAVHDLELLEGQLFRENLKTKLFLAL